MLEVAKVKRESGMEIAQRQQQFSKFEKDTVIKCLKDNLENHRKEYAEAVALWKKVLLKEVQERAEVLQKFASENGGTDPSKIKVPDTWVVERRPVSHVEEFEQAIREFELVSEEFLYLSRKDVNKYIHNKWSWVQAHSAGLESLSMKASAYGLE